MIARLYIKIKCGITYESLDEVVILCLLLKAHIVAIIQ